MHKKCNFKKETNYIPFRKNFAENLKNQNNIINQEEGSF